MTPLSMNGFYVPSCPQGTMTHKAIGGNPPHPLSGCHSVRLMGRALWRGLTVIVKMLTSSFDRAQVKSADVPPSQRNKVSRQKTKAAPPGSWGIRGLVSSNGDKYALLL